MRQTGAFVSRLIVAVLIWVRWELRAVRASLVARRCGSAPAAGGPRWPRSQGAATSHGLLRAGRLGRYERCDPEIRSGGRGSKDCSGKPLPLYDTPYEPAENGGCGDDSDPERSRCGRESRLPQDDERPPEEYDQPWEWKKERISKAFAALLCYDCLSYEDTVNGTAGTVPHRRMDCTAKSLTVQFEGVDKPRGSPPGEAKTRPPQRHSSGCLVNTKMTPLDHCSPSQGERIDPGLPLENQFWYHGAVSRTDAESLLRLCKEASYLVRNSETSKNDFSLSLKSSQGFMHMKLARTKEGKYVLGQNSCPFDSVPEIIHFYSSRKLPIKGAEHMSLLYPVAIRTL
ncbi:unnamed protein product [Boreogadus saida]